MIDRHLIRFGTAAVHLTLAAQTVGIAAVKGTAVKILQHEAVPQQAGFVGGADGDGETRPLTPAVTAHGDQKDAFAVLPMAHETLLIRHRVNHIKP